MVAGLSNRVNPVNNGLFNIVLGRYCPEIEAVISKAKSLGYQLPTDYQLRILDIDIKEKKAANIWSKHDTVFWFGLNSLNTNFNNFTNISGGLVLSFMNFTLIDFKNPSRIAQLVQSSNSPYLNKAGIQNNIDAASSGYIVTNFYPGASNNKWLQNDASFSLYVSYLGDQSAPDAGGQQLVGLTDTGTPRRVASFVPRSVSDATTGNLNRSNNGAESTFVASGVTENAGYHSLDRTASNLTTYYKNGVSLGTSAQASGTIPSNYPLALMTQWIDGVSGANQKYRRSPLSNFAGGGSLGATLQKIDYEITKNTINKLGYQ